jgi:hypothetical protein
MDSMQFPKVAGLQKQMIKNRKVDLNGENVNWLATIVQR